MFDHTRITGTPDLWIALPDGYEPGSGYKRTATGTKAALEMFREVNRIIEKLTPRPADQTNARLIIGYSPVLLDDRTIKAEVERIQRNGEHYGVLAEPTHDARKAR
jgi:hypothetical protein